MDNQERLLIAPLIGSMSEIREKQEQFKEFAQRTSLPEGFRLAIEYRPDQILSPVKIEELKSSPSQLENEVRHHFECFINIILAKSPAGIPYIFTPRIEGEGGNFPQALSSLRLDYYEEVMQNYDAWGIDIEINQLPHYPEERLLDRPDDVKIIGSRHYFKHQTKPQDLAGAAAHMVDSDGCKYIDIFKLAAWSEDDKEDVHIADTTGSFSRKGYPSIVVPMGDRLETEIMRCVMPFLGSTATYGRFGKGTAQGQPPIEILAEVVSNLYKERNHQDLIKRAAKYYKEASKQH